MKNCSVFASLISPSKMILFEKKYQTFDTVFHHQMKHLEVRQKYSAARCIFNSLPGVSSGDETLRLMFDIIITYKMHIMNSLPKCRCVQVSFRKRRPVGQFSWVITEPLHFGWSLTRGLTVLIYWLIDLLFFILLIQSKGCLGYWTTTSKQHIEF